jgi:hypothetical protein
MGVGHRKFQPVFQEPQQGLAHAPQLAELSEHQLYGFLDTPIRILLQPQIALAIAHGAGDQQLSSSRFLPARLDRTLPQEVELVFVEAALESEQQAIIALSGRIDHLPIDQDGVDHAADFDQLLPLATVARKARDFARRHCADLAETHLGYHPLEPATRHQTGGRTPEILVDDFDLTPAHLHQPLLHRILQLLALQVVADLVGRGLTNVHNGLAR